MSCRKPPLPAYIRYMGIVFGTALILLTGSIPSRAQTGMTPKERMFQSVATVFELNTQLDARIDQAGEVRRELAHQLQELVAESRQQRERLKITSYQEAGKCPRIFYNLKLAGRLTAYIVRLDQKIDYLQSGRETLHTLLRQAEDDTRIIDTLNDLKVDALLNRMARVVDEYQPEIQNFLFQLDEVAVPPPAQVWKTVMID